MTTSKLHTLPQLTGLMLIATACLLLVGGRAEAQVCGVAQLAPVVKGEVWQGYGEANPLFTGSDAVGSRGIVYRASANALVTAPIAGQVEYAGPVENLGQVVILNIGGDRRVVLTGLSGLRVRTGDRIAQGGRLGATAPAHGEAAFVYMELRCGEEPVNPTPVKTVAMQ
ncbi:peptidase family M23 family protein [Asticcacaulis biprosthecium C19]|uniref:Peptidase family M23 family protein n=1 Tax=Asticcacaulis biprosthecium C19 TaxID=715226 RepID=F4QKC7_9CAUL|nr:peptidoglycan DD-metalloendopeptidase family protein [Asticcacaulis biprosthecium]EGF93305.1 peptidase family M23 family protein [Asticcacaulis biprosthecium C19]